MVAEEALRRWAAVDTVTAEPVEIIAPRAHILLRPGARESFDALRIDHPTALPVLAKLEVDGTPVMRTWNLVRLQSKLLSPAAEAFRYFVLEHAEAYLKDHDQALLNPPV